MSVGGMFLRFILLYGMVHGAQVEHVSVLESLELVQKRHAELQAVCRNSCCFFFRFSDTAVSEVL